MKKIFLDTNFLLIPGALKVDIFSEIGRVMDEPYEIRVLDRSMDELNDIMARQTGKDRDSARLALQLIEKKQVKIIDADEELKQKSLNTKADSKKLIVDDILLKISDNDTIVATQDAGLKKRLAEKGVKTIILRGKKQLEQR